MRSLETASSGCVIGVAHTSISAKIRAFFTPLVFHTRIATSLTALRDATPAFSPHRLAALAVYVVVVPCRCSKVYWRTRERQMFIDDNLDRRVAYSVAGTIVVNGTMCLRVRRNVPAVRAAVLPKLRCDDIVLAFRRQSTAQEQRFPTCRNIRSTSTRSNCLIANSKRGCEGCRQASGPSVRSCRCSVLGNAPTFFGMQVMVRMNGTPENFPNSFGIFSHHKQLAERPHDAADFVTARRSIAEPASPVAPGASAGSSS